MRIPILLSILLAGIGAISLMGKRDPIIAPTGPMAITARPLVLDSAHPERTKLGALHFLGAWQLTGPSNRFGGLSSLQIDPNGWIWSLSDTGSMFIFPKPGSPGMGQVVRLARHKPLKKWDSEATDSESMAVDPAFAHIWVGYELFQRVCRFTTELERLPICRDWPEMKSWPKDMSLESMARLPDGRFLFISEGVKNDEMGHEALLFMGDPASPRTPHPIPMKYVPPTGYDPTDAVAIGEGQLLVLNRRATMYDGFTAIITLVDIGDMRPGTVLKGREIAAFVPPVLADNFEGLALERGSNGQRLLWVVSDDNHLFFQRTLLLKFALPDRF